MHNYAAKGAIDIAIWDALGKTLNVSVSALLGNHSTAMRVSHMLGFGDPPAVTEEAKSFRERYGVTTFKIKVGRQPVAPDLELCRVLAAELGDDVELYVDANRGWSANQAVGALPVLVEAGVTLFEEPCDAREGMGRRRLVSNCPASRSSATRAFPTPAMPHANCCPRAAPRSASRPPAADSPTRWPFCTCAPAWASTW